MTNHALLPKLLPVLFFLTLASLSFLLNFNGLYGQDAHEYLRQSNVIFDRWQGLSIPLPGLGDAEFAGGYPLAGAAMRLLLGNSIWAMQVVSWLAGAFGLLIFERLLALLAPGVRTESRWVFAGLGLVFAPMFFRAGLTSMSDAMGLALALAAFFFGLRTFENGRTIDILAAAVFGAGAISTRFALAALLLPLALAIGYQWLTSKKWFALAAALGAFSLAMLPHFWLKAGGAENPLMHSMLQHWSVGNFFQRTFSNENGLVHYTLPNILFLGFPFAHPAFCLGLPGLFFLFKKTDLVLPAKRILLVSVLVYLMLLGGIPHQNLRHLLPAYTLVLLLLFPAWDRFYCYGFLFFRRLTTWLLVGALSLQLLCCVKYLAPTLARNHLERKVASQLKAVLPPNAIVYAFDLDVAMRSYLPGVQYKNLWERRYPDFPAGSFVLFNEALRPQWQGQNPILNWDFLKENYSLKQRATLPEGWELWEIE